MSRNNYSDERCGALEPSGSVCTTCVNIKIPHSAHTIYFCISCGSQDKQHSVVDPCSYEVRSDLLCYLGDIESLRGSRNLNFVSCMSFLSKNPDIVFREI